MISTSQLFTPQSITDELDSVTWMMPGKKEEREREREETKHKNCAKSFPLHSIGPAAIKTDGPSFKSSRLETELKLVFITAYILCLPEPASVEAHSFCWIKQNLAMRIRPLVGMHGIINT